MPTRALQILVGLVFLLVVGLHSSIAAMELLSWSVFLTVVGTKLVARQKFHFPLWIPLVGLTGVVGTSLLVNPELRPFWFQFGFMRWIFLLWAYVWAFELIWDNTFEKRLLRIWTVAVVACAVYASLQSVFGWDPVHPRSELNNMGGSFYRATGFFSLTLTFGYVIGTSYLAIFFSSARAGSKKWQLVLWVAGLAAVLATLSRGAILGLVAAGLVYFLVYARKYLPYFIGAAVSALVALSFVSKTLSDTLQLKLEHSSELRLNLWRAYWQMFLDHPIFGVGIFQGDRLLTEYYERLGVTEHYLSHAHNVPLQWLAGAGILGLILYVWISGYFLMMSWRLAKTSIWGGSLLMAQVYWHVGSLTEANFFDGEVTHMIVFTWAVLLFLYRRDVVASASGAQSKINPAQP